MNISNVPAALASNESVAEALATAKAKDAALKAKLSELDQFLNPETHIHALKEIIRNETDFEIVQSAQSKIAEISSQKDDVREKAQSIVRSLSNELIASLRDLCAVALQETDNMTAQAKAAEKQFFSGFGIEGGSTALVKHIQNHAAQLRQMLDGFDLHFKRPMPTLGTVAPSSGAYVFSWFGH